MGGRISSLLAVLTLCACGGGAASGAGPETGGVSDESGGAGDDVAANESAAHASEDAKPPSKEEQPAAAAESEVSTLEGEDLEAVLQGVLSDPELLDHLHLDKPGRAPLQISGPNLPDKLKVVAGSYDVKVVAEPTGKKKAVLVFTMIERSGEQARVHYRFDVEGIRGSATLSLKNGHWMLAANRVIEK
jgi:hypothetical protein